MAKIVANDTPIPGSVGQRIQTIITGRDTTAAAQNLITFVDGADRIEIAGTFSNPAANTFVGNASRITVFIAGSTALTISEFSISAQQVYDAILNSSFALFDLLRPIEFVGGEGSDEFYDGTFENDSLSGAGGDDQLDAGDGDDTIDGGEGEDYMEGGDGADVYFVDDLGDYVREDNDVPGIDEVRSTISLSLGDPDIFGSDYDGDLVENLTLLGDKNLDGTGNTLRNVILGNTGNNELDGLGDRDELFGGNGDDRILGGKGGDLLDGGKGADELIGGGGGDVLTGGAGGDRFTYLSPAESGTIGFARDTISDFSRKAGDSIDLSRLDANEEKRGNQKFDFVGDDEFSGKKGELRSVSVQDENLVYADTDGDKVADFSIIVAGVGKLVEGDFLL